jgi:hypothetical protein
LQTPASQFSDLAEKSRERGEGKGEGKEGKYGASPRGAVRALGGEGVVGAWPTASVTREEEETIGGDEADRWVPPVIGGREGESTLSGF